MRRSQLGEAWRARVDLPRNCMRRMQGRIVSLVNLGNYDVFMSHRGPDTKTGFTAHLHEKLQLAGLEAFFDCRDIGKGEDSWGSIERAITNMRLALVIFSENFAGSKRCLKEIHLTLNTASIRVLPIFFKVKPGDVGGSLGIARRAESQKQGCRTGISKYGEMISKSQYHVLCLFFFLPFYFY